MACFGSPKFDQKEPLHILSADCRFPDLIPGTQADAGNHFMAVFPERDMMRRGGGWNGVSVSSGRGVTLFILSSLVMGGVIYVYVFVAISETG